MIADENKDHLPIRLIEYNCLLHMKASKLFALLVIFISIELTSCATTYSSGQSDLESKPKNIDNICQIFNEKNHWLMPAKASYDKWGIPVELMMAIIRYESSFRASARPLDSKGKRLSSAYGYAQAIDGTWNIYKRVNSNPTAQRTDFADAIDFVGWYSSKSLQNRDGISPYDVNTLYVLYHDGWGALPEDGSRKIKSKVLEVAAKIYSKTLLYHRQLKRCSTIANSLYTKPNTIWGTGKSNKKNNNENWF